MNLEEGPERSVTLYGSGEVNTAMVARVGDRGSWMAFLVNGLQQLH